MPRTDRPELSFIEPVPGSRIARKYRYDIWQSQEFLEALSDWDIDGLIIGGVELTCCVLYAVLGAEEHGLHYVVPIDLVSGCAAASRLATAHRATDLRSEHPSVTQADGPASQMASQASCMVRARRGRERQSARRKASSVTHLLVSGSSAGLVR